MTKYRVTKFFKTIMSFLLVLTIFSECFGITSHAAASPTVWYCSHIQDRGWLPTVTNGSTSGYTGLALQMEAFQVDVSGINGNVIYRCHVADKGWLSWVSDGNTSGTTGEARRIEAVQLKLTGQAANEFDILYRVHVADKGWLPWVSNGATSGTTGEARRAEAIQIKLVSKSANTSTSSSVLENSKVQSFINDSRWKVGTIFNNSTPGQLPQTKSMGRGCNAYARDFVQYVYGKSLTKGTKYTSISELRAGDAVYVTPQHWMIILKREGATVEVIHGNWTNGKVCKSTFKINGNKIGSSKTFSYGYHY